MSKKTWADVKKLDVVELGGREWTVTKIKAGKKKADVTVEMGKRSASSTVALSDRVKITGRAKIAPSAVMDEYGTQTRWAKKSELREALGEKKGLAAGDASKTKPPKKPAGAAWDAKPEKGTAERTMRDLLSAHLVGESNDESAGYYVPPVDVSTVAAHLALFHAGLGADAALDEAGMLAAHAAAHVRALEDGSPLPVNHWHTAKRP